MGERLTLEQRRVVASLMEVYGSPTVLHQKSAGRDPVFYPNITSEGLNFNPQASARPTSRSYRHPRDTTHVKYAYRLLTHCTDVFQIVLKLNKGLGKGDALCFCCGRNLIFK
jgi:hypothetical protein